MVRMLMLQRHNELDFYKLHWPALTILRMQEGHAAESEAPEASHKLESSRGLCTWASYLSKEFGQAIKLSVHDLVNEIHEIETAKLFITATLITSAKHF